MHDKSVYEVKYPDRTAEQLTTKIIAENLISQVDSEGHHYQVLTEVTDQERDDCAIIKVDGFIKSSNWYLYRKRTTRGWKLLVELKDPQLIGFH